MKALEILNKLKNKMLNFTSIDVENATIEIEAMQEHNREWFLKIIKLTKQRDEAIAELEALQQRSCATCEYDGTFRYMGKDSRCTRCCNFFSNRYVPKEQ